MKKFILLALLFSFILPSSSYAQFGIEKRIKNKYKAKYKKEGRKHAEKGLSKAEDKGMEQADKGLNKATDAADPALDKAEEAEEKGEEYAIFGLKKYQEFSEGYENDVASKDPADYKKYPFESAVAVYKLEGSENGTKTVYIDKGGYKIAEYKTLKKRRNKEEKTTVMLIGSDIITIDYDNKSAVQMHNPMAYLLADPERDWQKTGEKMLIKMGYKIVGNETIEGKDCAIWKKGKQKLWLWKGLTLKAENKVGSKKSTETLTDLKMDTNIDDNIFKVPEGFELEVVGAGDILPQITDAEIDSLSQDENMDEILDEIEHMSYSEFKAKVLEEDPDTPDEEIRQSYLYLRQKARRRHQNEDDK